MMKLASTPAPVTTSRVRSYQELDNDPKKMTEFTLRPPRTMCFFCKHACLFTLTYVKMETR